MNAAVAKTAMRDGQLPVTPLGGHIGQGMLGLVVPATCNWGLDEGGNYLPTAVGGHLVVGFGTKPDMDISWRRAGEEGE